MGAGASLNLTKEAITKLTAEQLAAFAEEQRAHSFVVSTIKKEIIDGSLVYDLY